MDTQATKDCEGFVAQVDALRVAQRSLLSGAPDAIAAIRRITQSLQRADAVPASSEILKLSVRLQKTADQDLLTELEEIVPKLRALVSQLDSDRLVVLVIEDNRAMAEFIRQRLSAPHRDLCIVKTMAQAERVLAEKDVALAIVDLVLPDGDGRDFIARLRARSAIGYVPVIVVSSKTGPQVETECLALGADAYFAKPFDPLTLSIAVASKLQQAADMKRQAGYDLLTNLPNRAAFHRAFKRASLLALRSGEPLSVALLDLDLFKAVNDMYGHATGDEVLQRVSRIIVRSLRTSDLVARWGGEELAVLFPNTDMVSAQVALNSALEAVRAEKFVSKDGRDFSLSFSGGVACVREGRSADDAIAEADRILYLAKQSGRNRILSPLDKPPSSKRTILIVEDNAAMAAAMKHHLRGHGFQFLHALDGARAMHFVEGHPISLITLDVHLPGIDGFKLLEQFRRVPALRGVPIIIVTSETQKEGILRGFRLGVDDYLKKPYAPAELRARVHRFLRPLVAEKPL